MTPEELRSLADEATPGPWAVLADGSPLIRRGTGETLYAGKADARLIALAPDLARLCVELGGALVKIHNQSNDVRIRERAARAVAKLSELES